MPHVCRPPTHEATIRGLPDCRRAAPSRLGSKEPSSLLCSVAKSGMQGSCAHVCLRAGVQQALQPKVPHLD